VKVKILENLISLVGRCVNKLGEWEKVADKIRSGDGKLDDLFMDVARNADCEDLFPRSFNAAFKDLKDGDLEKFKRSLRFAREELNMRETARYAASSFLKKFIPISKPSMFDANFVRRYKKISWPDELCEYIKICLEHGGYAVSFYTIPFEKNVVQARCLQHEYAIEKWGKVESVMVENVPYEWRERMREEIGEWRIIWKEVCKGGEI